MSNKLSQVQQAFLKALFSVHNGNLKQASKEVLGTEDYSSLMTDELVSAIKKRADNELVMNVPKALFIMNKMLEEPENILFLDKLHKVCADILDRAGISKQERSSSQNVTIGIVMLPSKAELPEPPTIEHMQKFEGPILLTQPVKINDLQT